MGDIEKHQFIESMIRSGIFMICEGYDEIGDKLLNHTMLTSQQNISYT